MLDDQNNPIETGPEPTPPAGKVRVKLVSPLQPVIEMEVDKVLIPASKGDILILPERAPIIFTLRAGKLITFNGKEQKTFYVSKGVCEVRRNICPVLAWTVAEGGMTRTEIQERLKVTQHNLERAATSDNKKEIMDRIDFLNFMLKEVRE